MTPTPNLTDLIARIEAATGPDRELDTEIASMFDKDFAESRLLHALNFTASIDASLALAERVLPEGSVAARIYDAFHAMLPDNYRADQPFGPQFARYILAATLHAYALRQGGA